MLRLNSLADVPRDFGPTVVTIGNFDGVHRGHLAVLRQVREQAEQRGARSVAVTFWPHPRAVLFPDVALPEVTALEQRLERLEQSGIDAVLVQEFTHELAQQTPEEYVQTTFVEGLRACAVVVGHDVRFGVRNSGDLTTLTELGREHGFDVVPIHDLGDESHHRWSSTQLREAIAAGDMAAAASVMGRLHEVRGEVVHGFHRGRGLGFPTANLEPESQGLVPPDGVYAGWLVRPSLAECEPDHRLPAAISVGTNPTFDGHERTVEAYVLDRTDLDLYGERVVVQFAEWLRGMLTFSSVDELIEQMRADVVDTKRALTADARA